MNTRDISILIVEDDPLVAKDIQNKLEKQNYNVSGIVNTALEAINHTATNPTDLVLMDIVLPGTMDGIQAAAAIRHKQNIPIIYLTAHCEQAFLDRARITDPMAYIIKPATERDLHAAISIAIHQAENERQRQEKNLLDATLVSLSDALLAWNSKGKIIRVNNALLNLLHCKKTECLGREVSEVLVLKNAANGRVITEKLIYLIEIQGYFKEDWDLILQCDNTTQVSVRISGSRILDQHKQCLGYAMLIRDDTERKRHEEQIGRSQKMDALGKLTGGIAHDYNNMLGVVMGYAQLLEKTLTGNPKLANYAHQIHCAAERGSKLTKKLLNFSRRQMSDAKMLNLNALLKNEQHMLEKTLTARIQLILDLADELWPIRIDGSDLVDAIINMSINAMHAIDGNGQLTIRTRNTSVNENDAQLLQLDVGDYVLFSMTDTGCGMDEKTKEKIFEPFYSTKGEKGTGLGLSQVHGFAGRSGATIKVYSEPGHGTRFDLYFPRYHEDIVKDKETEANHAADFRGMETILVVDDETALMNLTTEILSQQGYRVLCAENGKQALQILENEDINLLLSDVIMPEMDGYQLASWVQEKYPNIKIQLVSGFADEHQADFVDISLQQKLLHKPFNSQTLLQRIRELLDE